MQWYDILPACLQRVFFRPPHPSHLEFTHHQHAELETSVTEVEPTTETAAAPFIVPPELKQPAYAAFTP